VRDQGFCAGLWRPSSAGQPRRRRIGIAALAIAALVLLGCEGRTTGASRFNSANNTIALNGVGSCDTQCTAYIHYRRLGTSPWTDTPTFGVNSKVTNASFSQTVTVTPGLKYEYQVCGKENSQSQFFCAGPDGTGATTEVFTAGALQAHTDAATNVYDVNATLNGQIEWTKSGQVTWWFQYGRTTTYGDFTFATTQALSANVPKSVSSFIYTARSTTYHYRLCVVKGANATPGDPAAVCGGDRTLTTNTGTAVTCGQTITTSTKLGNDLNLCPGDGLVVGAPNITLDLNGHSISAKDTGLPDLTCPYPTDAPSYGVNNGGGYDGVTIKNGSVGAVFNGFNDGVWLNDADDNTLQNLAVGGHMCMGIALLDSDRVQIVDNTISGPTYHTKCCGRNIYVETGTGDVIRNNTVIDGSHSGIQLWGTDDSRVESNVVSGTEFDFGIELLFGSLNNQVIANSVSGPILDGIVMAVGSSNNVVDRNTVSNMTAADPDPSDPGQFAAIEAIDRASGNQITNNQLLDNRPPGIAIGLPLSGSQGPSNANTVSGNTSLRSMGDGIIVGTMATNTVIRQNVTSNNGDDGIDVDVASTTITGNTARNNTDLGIEAVAGVTDGGGNHASGNGNPTRQCLNVACSP
jgi:parallel beta-helix repeat protein